MGDPLQERRPLRELAGDHQLFEISAKIGDFERLVEIVKADLSALGPAAVRDDWRELPVTGRLAFDAVPAQDDMARLEMRLSMTMLAVCQRCLEAFELVVDTELDLLLAAPGTAPDEQAEYEAWELADDTVVPGDIVEEALIMALPLSAKHTDSVDCVETTVVEQGEEMTTPFAALRQQMDEKD